VTNADLYWLVIKGYVEQAVECGSPQKPEREFSIWGKSPIAERSAFILTDSGLALVSGRTHVQEPSETEKEKKNIPHYDLMRRQLWFAGELVKYFRVPAQNQELILMAFEEEGWPRHIDDPLPGQPDIEPIRRLQDAIRRLNGNLRGKLRFRGRGDGRGIRWQATEAA